MADSTSTPTRLVNVEDLDERQVTVVDTSHGTLAVGLSGGEPFAVSNRCRHLFASLGEGHVAEDGMSRVPVARGSLRHTLRRDDTRPAGRVQALGGPCEGHDRRPGTQDIPGRTARRRDLVGGLATAGPVRADGGRLLGSPGDCSGGL